MATKKTPAKGQQPTQQAAESVRLSQEELLAFRADARREYERFQDYGGDRSTAIVALLLVDLLLELKGPGREALAVHL